jgi:hypothetical protein
LTLAFHWPVSTLAEETLALVVLALDGARNRLDQPGTCRHGASESV